jgi:hypothetical protein
VQVVGVDDGSYPGEVFGAGSLGAVRTGPLSLAVETSETLAIDIQLACSVARAVVVT